jgi:hypothetical protein
MADIHLHNFRLRLVGHQTSEAKLFRCRRNEFRSAIADALIELRLADRSAPLILEVAFRVKNDLQWLAMDAGNSQGVHLPELIRWECVGDFYDRLVRRFWLEVEKYRRPITQVSLESADASL